MPVEIIPFKKEYAVHFKDLNVTWLKKYFYVEEKDAQLLDDCENSILNKGGYIYFAKYNNQIVGCFSLIPYDKDGFELGKMAVDPAYQGLRIGQQLLEFAIAMGRDKKWNKIVLYSSTKLPRALYIYKKYGFKEVVLESDLPYERSDIKMELPLV